MRFGVPIGLADEIFQETCIILLEKLDTLREADRISSWLITTTRRLCIQHWRTNAKKTEIELDDALDVSDGTAIEDDLAALAQQNLVQEAMKRLSERDQALLRALYFEDPPWSYQEISERLGISLGSVGPLRARSLEKFQRELNYVDTLMKK